MHFENKKDGNIDVLLLNINGGVLNLISVRLLFVLLKRRFSYMSNT